MQDKTLDMHIFLIDSQALKLLITCQAVGGRLAVDNVSNSIYETDGRTDRRRAASVRPSVCHESQRRRHGVTAAIAVDLVAVRVCPSVRPFVSNSI